MEVFLFAGVCMAALVVLDVLAVAYGTDSRDGSRESDREPRLRRGF